MPTIYVIGRLGKNPRNQQWRKINKKVSGSPGPQAATKQLFNLKACIELLSLHTSGGSIYLVIKDSGLRNYNMILKSLSPNSLTTRYLDPLGTTSRCDVKISASPGIFRKAYGVFNRRPTTCCGVPPKSLHVALW